MVSSNITELCYENFIYASIAGKENESDFKCSGNSSKIIDERLNGRKS
jgi:hypothetical protein